MSPTYRVRARPGDWWFVPGDIHFPTEDKPALLKAMEWFTERAARVRKAKGRVGVCLQGDTLDLWGLSSFSKSSKRVWQSGRIKQEVDAAWPFFEWCAKITHELPWVMILGNHEARAQRFLDDHHTLDGLPGVEFGALTGIDKLPVELVDHGGRLLLGNRLVVCHGDRLTGWKSVTAVARNYPDQVTVYGHTHHIASHLRTIYGPDDKPRVLGAYNIGHLSMRPEYYADPDWQLGFAEIEFLPGPLRHGGQPFFSVHQRQVLTNARGEVTVA